MFTHPGHGPVSWESQKRSEEGTRGFGAQVCVPGGAFSGFQYLTPPVGTLPEVDETALGALDTVRDRGKRSA
jgi:hypothetical protein